MRQRPTFRVAVATAAALFAMSACGSGDDASDTTTTSTTEEVSDTTVPDTAPPTSFDVPQVTAETLPPETTTTAAADTTTTAAPTTTEEPTPVEEQVSAAAIEAREAYLYAVYNPDAPDALDRLRASTTGSSLDIGLRNYQSIVDNGWVVRPDPETPSSLTPESVTIIDDTTAEAVVCEVSAGVVVAPGANTDGADVIVNDEIGSNRNRVTLILEDDTWKLSEGTNIDTYPGATTCAS